MKVIFGSDEKTHLTDFIAEWLQAAGHAVTKVGHLQSDKELWKWADIGKQVGQQVAGGAYDFGIVCCTSGTGVCMAANRYKQARAALCWDAETARLARKWDDANILCLSLRFTSETMANEILTAFFATKFDEEDLNQVHLLATN